MTGKSPNGSGTQPHQIKDNRWRSGLTVNGKRVWLYGRTEREVQRKLVEALNLRDRGLAISDDRRAFAAHLAAWLETIAPNISRRSMLIYSSAVRLHVGPALGDLPLARIRPETIERYYAERIAAGASAATVRGEHVVISASLEKAVVWGLLQSNPAKRAKAPRVQTSECRILTPEQVRRFVAAARNDAHEAMWLVSITTGLRQGELLSLQWQDVDLDAALLTVAHNYGRDRLLGPTKGRKIRRIQLTREVVAALRRLRHAEPLSPWLWPSPVCVGEPIGHSAASKLLRNFLRRNDLPAITPHGMRHSCATALMALGVSARVVQEMLGHSTVSITLGLYSHVLPSMQEEAVESLERWLR